MTAPRRRVCGVKRYKMDEKIKKAKELVKKHLTSRRRIAEIISLIIYETLVIEKELDNFILNNFVKKDMSNEFSNNILADENFPASLKVKIIIRSKELEKYGYKEVKKDLMRLFEIRNIVAHNMQDIRENTPTLIRKKEKIDLDKLWLEFSEIHTKMSVVFIRMKYPNRILKRTFEEDYSDFYEGISYYGKFIGDLDKK